MLFVIGSGGSLNIVFGMLVAGAIFRLVWGGDAIGGGGTSGERGAMVRGSGGDGGVNLF